MKKFRNVKLTIIILLIKAVLFFFIYFCISDYFRINDIKIFQYITLLFVFYWNFFLVLFLLSINIL